LTNEIGPEIFINDFILNKDIARFFFFDSEQIVALAETNTAAEKRKLCSAYNEVLGVRKYEELKHNLENVRLRFRKKSSDIESRNKLFALIEKQSLKKSEVEDLKMKSDNFDARLSELNARNIELQEQLMREGNNTTVQEIDRLQTVLDTTRNKDTEFKSQLKDFLEYAPLALAGNLLSKTKSRVEKDFTISKQNENLSNRNLIISDITSDLLLMIHRADITEGQKVKLQGSVQDILAKYQGNISSEETLTSLSQEDFEEFTSIYTYITSTYRAEFERLTEDYKKNRQILERTARRLSTIQSKENDALIKNIREEKNSIELEIAELHNEIKDIHVQIGVKNQELGIITKQVSELSKKVNLSDVDNYKDELAESLISELNEFLFALKQEKKYSLERRIKTILNSLMHKEDFIQHVEVNIVNEDMDIELYSTNENVINKDSLSKGEQQLYATSILKSLVEESGIQFPVFIDSPLQKFDKSHATKIITEFYPQISKQVILFPLLYKELTPDELDVMKPLINSAYLIKNDVTHSYFEKVDVDKIM
jgi:DNA sulfur modification protein DndD